MYILLVFFRLNPEFKFKLRPSHTVEIVLVTRVVQYIIIIIIICRGMITYNNIMLAADIEVYFKRSGSCVHII